MWVCACVRERCEIWEVNAVRVISQSIKKLMLTSWPLSQQHGIHYHDNKTMCTRIGVCVCDCDLVMPRLGKGKKEECEERERLTTSCCLFDHWGFDQLTLSCGVICAIIVSLQRGARRTINGHAKRKRKCWGSFFFFFRLLENLIQLCRKQSLVLNVCALVCVCVCLSVCEVSPLWWQTTWMLTFERMTFSFIN